MNRGKGSSKARGGNSRPPGLKGREIGMYYKNLSQKRKEENEKEPRILLGGDVTVPSGILREVQECINNYMKNTTESLEICTKFEQEFKKMCCSNFEDFINESQGINGLPKEKAMELNKHFKTEWEQHVLNKEYQKRLTERMKLPAYKQKSEILEAISKNQVILIAGSTGCGKTTQVPQMLLDALIEQSRGTEACIVCTQPRRICATSVAERVAYERNENLGKSVGYQIRLERFEYI